MKPISNNCCLGFNNLVSYFFNDLILNRTRQENEEFDLFLLLQNTIIIKHFFVVVSILERLKKFILFEIVSDLLLHLLCPMFFLRKMFNIIIWSAKKCQFY
jgi:hypothetical protein